MENSSSSHLIPLSDVALSSDTCKRRVESFLSFKNLTSNTDPHSEQFFSSFPFDETIYVRSSAAFTQPFHSYR